MAHILFPLDGAGLIIVQRKECQFLVKLCGKSILASGAAEFFSLPFLYPQPISNFQPLGGFRDQFSSQKLPTPPTCLLLAWMTDLYFWEEETYAHPLLSTSTIFSSVRKHQGMHNFSHLCTQAHASCFKV